MKVPFKSQQAHLLASDRIPITSIPNSIFQLPQAIALNQAKGS